MAKELSINPPNQALKPWLVITEKDGEFDLEITTGKEFIKMHLTQHQVAYLEFKLGECLFRKSTGDSLKQSKFTPPADFALPTTS